MILGRNAVEDIALDERHVVARDQLFGTALDARDDELVVDDLPDVGDFVADQVRIGDGDGDAFELLRVVVDLRVVVRHLLVDTDREQQADEQHGQDDAENAERVGQRVAHAGDRRVVVAAVFGKQLLRGAEPRRIGDGAALRCR